MGSYHGPKAKMQRRFGETLIPRPKYQRILEKRPYPPGEHGKEKQYRSGRRSDYGLQLNEKQKLAFIYNIRERQMRNYFVKARQMPGTTGDSMLILMECRLDNMVYRMGLGATIWAARQLVKHGHINVDGKRVDLPSFQVQPGMEIAVSEKMQKNVHVQQWVEETTAAPDYIAMNRDKFAGTLMRLPEGREIPVPVDIQLVVEYYTRLT